MAHKDSNSYKNELIVLQKLLEEAIWQIIYLEDLLRGHNISFGNKAFLEFKDKNPLKIAEVMQKIEKAKALAYSNQSSSSQVCNSDARSEATSTVISSANKESNEIPREDALKQSSDGLSEPSIACDSCQKENNITSGALKDEQTRDVVTDKSVNLKSSDGSLDYYSALLANHIQDQASLIQRIPISQNEINLFKLYFKGREEVFSLSSGKPNSKTHKYCYYPVCSTYWKHNCPRFNKANDEVDSSFVDAGVNDSTYQNKKVKRIACKECPARDFVKLIEPFIKNHLVGFKDDCSDVIGLYVSTEDSKCYFLVFDFDNHFISDYGSVEESLLDSNYNQQLQEATYLKRSSALNQESTFDEAAQNQNVQEAQRYDGKTNKPQALITAQKSSKNEESLTNQPDSKDLSLDKRLVSEVLSLCNVCKQEKIDYLLERSRSGSGYHLWIFFKEALELKLVRQFGSLLLSIGAKNLGLSTFRTFDRMIPTQDYVPKGGFGNLIALPLQGRALLRGNSAFVDDNFNAYNNQFERLENVHKHDLNFVLGKIKLWSNILLNQVSFGIDNCHVALKNQANSPNDVYSSNPSIANLTNCDKHVNSSFYNVDLANEFSLEIEKLVDDDSRSSNNDEIYTKENFLDFLVKSNKNPLSKFVDSTVFDNQLSKRVLSCFSSSDVLPISVIVESDEIKQSENSAKLSQPNLKLKTENLGSKEADLALNKDCNDKDNDAKKLFDNSSYINLLSRFDAFNFEDLKKPCVYIIFSNSVAIFKKNLKPSLVTQLKALCSYQNPLFYKYQAKGFQNLLHNEPRIFQCFYEDHDFIYLPRGLYQVVTDGFKASKICYLVKDLRDQGSELNTEFTGKLKEEQQKAVDAVLTSDYGIVNAATGFGKTVVATFLIHKFKVNTLIVVHKKELAQQWIAKLNELLTFNMLLPNYQTKSGKEKQNKTHIGHLWSSSNTLSHLVDVALVQSLFSEGRLKTELLNNYGMVIFDECHHSAATSYYSILSYVNAKRVYGFSATIKRDDRQEKKFLYQLGPVLYSYLAKQKALESNLPHYVFIRFTPFTSKNSESNNYNLLLEELINCKNRNRKIIDDVRECILNQRTPLVLTNRVDHAKALSKAFIDGNVAKHVILIVGNTSNKETQQRRAYLESIPDNESLVIVATGQCVGEGFDYPRLDTLMLTCPIKNNVNVEQYAGRLTREYPNKKDIIVYDYLDMQVGIFNHMFEHRKRTYKRIGYEIVTHESQNRALLKAFEQKALENMSLGENANFTEDLNVQSSIPNKVAGDGDTLTEGLDNGELSSLSLDLSLLNQDSFLENISFKRQKGMYSDLEYEEDFKNDFYNAQDEIIVFASSMDVSRVKAFSLKVQKLIEFGVKVAIVTCKKALQQRHDEKCEDRDFYIALNQSPTTEDLSNELNDSRSCTGRINFISKVSADNIDGSFTARSKKISAKSKSSVYLDNVISTLRQVGIEVSLRSSLPQSFVIIDQKIAWFALNPLDLVEKNSIFIRIDSPMDVQELLEIAYQS